MDKPELIKLTKNPKTFREILLSHEDKLFKKYPKNPSVIGPRLSSDGAVTGDLLFYEINYFNEVANKEQINLFNYLVETNLPLAYEYLLRIINSLDIWKEDLSLLSLWTKIISQDLTLENKQEKIIKKAKKLELTDKIPSVLRKHFPIYFTSYELQLPKFDELLQEINNTKMNQLKEQKYLEEYIHKKKEEMPFLFD